MSEHIFWKAQVITASCESIYCKTVTKNRFKITWIFERETNFKGLLKSSLLHVKNVYVEYVKVKWVECPVINSALYSTSITENRNDLAYLLFNNALNVVAVQILSVLMCY